MSLEAIKEEDEEQPEQPNRTLPKQQEYIKLEEHSSGNDSVASCRYQRADLTDPYNENNVYHTPENVSRNQETLTTTASTSQLEHSLNKLQNLH